MPFRREIYNVGISDPSVIGGAAVTGTSTPNPNIQSPSLPAPSNGATPVPAGTRQPQGSLPQGASNFFPVQSLRRLGHRPDRQILTLHRRRTRINYLAKRAQRRHLQDHRALTASASKWRRSEQQHRRHGGSTLNHIGTLTVDQSGTGRMQQKVETVQVRNVVGQAIVIYSQVSSSATLSPNSNGNAGAATRTAVTDTPRGAPTQPTDPAALQPQPLKLRLRRVPVAAGIIRLVTDRRPPGSAGPQAAQPPVGTDGAVEQPAAAAPPTGQNIVRYRSQT